jgi:DNA-binding transcriptional LysR family regulator
LGFDSDDVLRFVLFMFSPFAPRLDAILPALPAFLRSESAVHELRAPAGTDAHAGFAVRLLSALAGAALESTLLAERELADGKLVAPLADRAQNIHYVGHYFVYPKSRHGDALIETFLAWLLGELGGS